MHVKIGQSYSACTVDPWIPALEDELSFTRVDHKHGYVKEGEERMTFTKKRLWHVPVETPTTGTIPSGLLSRALEIIQARGHTFEVADYRDLKRIKPMPQFDKLGKLREGQPETLIQIAHADGGIIVAATAFGKSFVITQSCLMYPNLRILVVSPRASVVNSLRERLIKTLGEDQVGQSGGGKNILDRRVMVTTTKSIKKVDPKKVDLLFFDEVHGVGDNQIAVDLSYFNRCRKFGFTASPVRGDKSEMCMEALFGRFLIEIAYQDAVEMGNVVPIDVYMVRVDGDVHQSKSTTYNKKHSYWRNDLRNKKIAQVAQRIDADKQCLIMVETLEHAIYLHQYLPEYTLVHFGSVTLEYHVFEWKEVDPGSVNKSVGWVRDDRGMLVRREAVDDSAEDWEEPARFAWAGTGETQKQYLERIEAAGLERRFLGRVKEYKELADIDMTDVREGDYYLVRNEEYILNIPKSSLSITTKEKEELRQKFESGELKKVISTTTWKEGVDFEQLEYLIRADGATSEVNSTQIPGRLSRLFDGKRNGILIDFRDEFNDWARNRTARRLTTYRGHGWQIHN